MTTNNRLFPEGAELQTQIAGRHRRGLIMQTMFMGSLVLAIIVLASLLYNIINAVFGYVAIENRIEPTELVQFVGADAATPLADLSKDQLVDILLEYEPRKARGKEADQLFYSDRVVFLTEGQLREGCTREEPLAACTSRSIRTQANVLKLVEELVVEPKVWKTWSLYDSLFNVSQIEREMGKLLVDHPGARIEFHSWINGDFIRSAQAPNPELAGVRTAIIGSLWVILITVLFSFPIGVGTAIYLEEYAVEDNLFNRVVQTNISNLAGVPSIIYGLLGVALFVFALEPFTSGNMFGSTTANGRTIISAGMTLGLLILPIIIIASQEAIRAVPSSVRMASYGLGATRWQTIWYHVLPSALPGILTGTILAMSRAIGETAPLVVVGASTFIRVDPNGPFAKFTVLPIQIYQWTARPQGAFQNIAAAGIIVLLVLLVTLNASAVLLRNRYSLKK